MLSWILRKVLGSKNQREVKRIRPLVEKINQLEQQFQSLTEDQLREKTVQWKKDLANIDDPDELARRSARDSARGVRHRKERSAPALGQNYPHL